MRSILSLLILLALTSGVSAAPIQGVIDAQTGAFTVCGMTGEIFLGIRASEEFLRRQYPDKIQAMIYPPGDDVEGEINILWLTGLNGCLDVGNVIAPGLQPADFAPFRLVYQRTFTSEIQSIPPTFVGSRSAIPAGQEGLFVVVPEPSTGFLVGAALLAVGQASRWTRRFVL